MTGREALTVSELNARIKGLIESDPALGSVCVRGELSNYKIYPSGHHYFTLKDAESSLRCVMFRSAASKLRFRPESGMGVTVCGRVSVYPRDGAYQLYCEELIPEGAGDLQLAYEQLKERLRREGLFDPAHKKPIPRYCEDHNDIVTCFDADTADALIGFCRGIQAASPVDSYAAPEPSPEPGYTDEVIMASGSFTQGSTIELSCDGPLREPYTCYLQGGLNFAASRAGVLLAVQNAYFKN